MPTITFIQPDGEAIEVDAIEGETVMETAMGNAVDGILADCGGACSCATCHGYVDEAWLDKLPEMDDAEESMVEFAIDRKPNSRLTCQLVVSEELDGMVIRLPATQV